MSSEEAAELAERYRALAEFCAAKAAGKELQISWEHIAGERGFFAWQTTDSVPTINADLSRWRIKPERRKAWSVGNYITENQSVATDWKEHGDDVTEWQEVVS